MLLRKLMPSRTEIFTASVAFVAVFAFLAMARNAHAGEVGGSPAVAFAGMSNATWNWIVFFTGTLVYAAQWVDPANAQTPWNMPVKARMVAFTVLGLVVGVLHLVTKDPSVPWTESLITGVMTVLLPGLLHFAPGMLAKAKTSGGVGPTVGAILLVGVIGSSATGCAAMTSAIGKDPAVYVADFELATGVVNDGAKALFPIVLAHLPAASQAAAQSEFDKAETAYGDSVTAINAALAAYRDGQSADWGKLIADATTAVDAIIAIIDEYGGTVTPLAASQHAQAIGPMYVYHREQIANAVLVVHRYH